MGWLERHPVRGGLAVGLAVLLAFWSVRLVELALSVDRYRDYWSVPRGEPGGLLYVALGDSAAQGIGASSPERGYVGLLAERLRRETGRPVQVVNLSRSGAKVEDVVREQLPRLDGLRPDVLTVAVGGNDLRTWRSSEFADSVEVLTAALPDGALLADVPYFMHDPWERDARAAARRVRAAALRDGLVPVDLHDAQRRQGWGAMRDSFAADWFHPNDKGHRVWAGAFWDALVRAPVGRRLGLSRAEAP